MTAIELGKILKDMYNNADKGGQVASIHLFGIMYAPQIMGHYSVNEIILASGLHKSYTTELNKGINIYKLIKSGKYSIKMELT